jgi:hypothetical protein
MNRSSVCEESPPAVSFRRMAGPGKEERRSSRKSLRAATVATALALLAGCAFPDALVRKRAATDFGCPEDEIVVHELASGYLARGCRKEAGYVVQDGRATRNSEIRRATVDERPPLPIDRVPGTNSIGLD